MLEYISVDRINLILQAIYLITDSRYILLIFVYCHIMIFVVRLFKKHLKDKMHCHKAKSKSKACLLGQSDNKTRAGQHVITII